LLGIYFFTLKAKHFPAPYTTLVLMFSTSIVLLDTKIIIIKYSNTITRTEDDLVEFLPAVSRNIEVSNQGLDQASNDSK